MVEVQMVLKVDSQRGMMVKGKIGIEVDAPT
jgi:hypothetical protein